MKKLLTKSQLESLKVYVQEQVRVRCIPAVITLDEVLSKRNLPAIKLSSTKFNTVPVLHSEVELIDWSSYIKVDAENKNIIKVGVSVHASYEGNGVCLFGVEGVFIKGETYFIVK